MNITGKCKGRERWKIIINEEYFITVIKTTIRHV